MLSEALRALYDKLIDAQSEIDMSRAGRHERVG
jgi:hypothetical protein